MPDYLLALSIGPVQDFIAAARRTRDLWYGSTLLSDVSKAVALNLKEQGATLIFPHDEADLDLKNQHINIANQIVTRIHADDAEKVCCIAESAKEAARDYWKEVASCAFNKVGGNTLINKEIWNSQINDVLELYAVWVPYAPGEKDAYKSARKRLMTLLSARKNTRDFRPGQGFSGKPKSLLDGARESVLPVRELSDEQLGICRDKGIKVVEIINPQSEFSSNKEKKYRCEPLDVSGVVKRVQSEEQKYPSVARVAADPWLRQLKQLEELNASKAQDIEQTQKIQKEISDFNTEIEKLKEQGSLSCISEKICPYEDFPYEGTIVYTERHRDIAQQKGISLPKNNTSPFPELHKSLQNLYQSVREPSPYLAVLYADGDRIGSALEAVESLEEHQEFSHSLSEFAKEARNIVEKKHHGVCVYAGGDDVLAFLPLDTCLDAASALHTCFEETLKNFPVAGKSPTLSVGIAIGHFMEELSQLRQWGKEAEKLAKGKESERDGLAIILHTRGGGDFKLQARWQSAPDQQLQQWIDMFRRGKLPRTLPYDLRQLLDLYEHQADPLIADVHRLLKIKGLDKHLLSGEIDQKSTYNALKDLIKMLLLASRISSHLPSSKETDS